MNKEKLEHHLRNLQERHTQLEKKINEMAIDINNMKNNV